MSSTNPIQTGNAGPFAPPASSKPEVQPENLTNTPVWKRGEVPSAKSGTESFVGVEENSGAEVDSEIKLSKELSTKEKAIEIFNKSAEFLGKAILGTLAGAVVGVAAIIVGPPLLLGIACIKIQEHAHKAMLNKAEAAGFKKDDRESPVLDYCKDGACRTAGEIKNYFTQRRAEARPLSPTEQARKGEDIEKYKNNINKLPSYAEKEGLSIGSFLSREDRDFWESVSTKKNLSLSDEEVNHLANISSKLDKRVEVYEEIILLRQNNIKPTEEEDNILDSLEAKMTGSPPRPLSASELDNAYKIINKYSRSEIE